MENTYQSVNPLACAVLVAVCLVMLLANGRNAIKALLFTATIIPLGQAFVVGGVRMHFFRVLIFMGIVRVLLRGESRGFQWNTVDKLMIWWGAAALVCSLIRGIRMEAVGYIFAAWGCYFLVRCLCQGPEDFLEHLRFVAILIFFIAACMCVESVALRNPFAIFGDVPVVPEMREGRPRCQGPFYIYILAGVFCATLFPLMAGLWLQGPPHRARAALGMVGSILGTYLCNSSGPLLCFMVAIMGFALWPMRHRMRLVRRAGVVLVVALALVMKAPVWYLIAKVGNIFGGTSWHRSYLIDQFVGHFTQWALVGTDYTANWAPSGIVLAGDPNNMDITNNYVMQGLRGGIWQFVLFLAIIVSCYAIVGRLLRENSDGGLAPKMRWALGVALAAHCTAFIDISYFDQSAVFWYWLLAVIACFPAYVLSAHAQAALEEENPAPESSPAPEGQPDGLEATTRLFS